jgi:hypothetical protein
MEIKGFWLNFRWPGAKNFPRGMKIKEKCLKNDNHKTALSSDYHKTAFTSDIGK